MGQPYPLAGNQQQYNERPLKVYGEQYVEGQPLPVGTVIDPMSGGQPLFQDGQPRVPLKIGWTVVALTDWVISSRHSGQPREVVSNEEFEERFGKGNVADLTPAKE